MNTKIEYYAVSQFGRIDFLPMSRKIADAVKKMNGRYSAVMTKRFMEGMELLGFEFIEVLPPRAEEKE